MSMFRGSTPQLLAVGAGIYVACLGASPVWANCYKVQSTSNSPSSSQIRPVDGKAATWEGAYDANRGPVGLPNVINLLDPALQPYPALLASSVVPLTTYGQPGGYDPEQVLLRCAQNDQVIEQYATNGDNYWGGYGGSSYTGDTLGNSLGLTGAMRTPWPNVLLKLTNVTTGDVLSYIWKGRVLTGLDIEQPGRPDGQQYKLVKAKNLSTIRLELYSAPTEVGGPGFVYSAGTMSQIQGYNQPAGYISLAGPGFYSDMRGLNHLNYYDGWYGAWPGNISLYNQVTLKRYPTCAVTTVTPTVLFPTVTVNELNSGGSRTEPFQIQFRCQTAATSGTAQNNTAMGIKASAGALAAAPGLGLQNVSGGLTYLLSDRYGQPGMANGVGIRILRNGSPINLLPDENSSTGAATANQKGWYGVLAGAQQKTATMSGIDHYTETFSATLEKLQSGTQPEVTPGKVEATAQVVIRVQ
ncbi:fimbrial protein [Pseudomonas schmalbachii]